MLLKLHFFLLNEDFSPEYAEANHDGKESENNRLYEWEDALEIREVKQVDFERNGQVLLQGVLPNDEAFSHLVAGMFVIRIETEEGQEAKLGVSESILDRYEWDENEALLKVYIKDYEPHGNPAPGIYIASKEFPKELVF
ncbi:MAG: hypothetical protein EP338_00300 [Bacteroidetes bacterium]|nr:MAG: hypothetical protein EP338_00300 [Bacteroidota bacterium]